MIPLRVKLAGFLSYRDEAILDFSGATLWMLRGPNGAGKSSVFDAISFALYGAHRGGVQGAESLIHHASSKLSVEFDFVLGPDTFRVQRTLSRGVAGRSGKPSFQVWHLEGPGAPWPGKPAPQAVPETNSAVGLKKWVEASIGLSRETFCASVLLQQNKSDALLEADPADRHEMLSQIVDLSAYRQLGDKADALARERKSHADALSRRLADLGPIDEAEIARLEEAESSLAARAEEAEARGREMAALRVHAERWNELAAEHGHIESALQAASGLLSQREVIERDAGRRADLDRALPLLETVQQETQRAEALQEDQAREHRAAQVLGEALEATVRDLEGAQVQVDDLRQSHQAASGRLMAAGAWLLEHSAALRDLESLRQAREQAQVLDAALAAYPADLDAQAHAAASRVDALASLKAALPRLEEWCEARSLFQAAREASRMAARTLHELAPSLDAARQTCASAEQTTEAHASIAGQATQNLTRAQTLLHSIEKSIARFEDVESEASCRYCGQVLTPEHRQSEAARLHRERQNAQNTRDAAVRERDQSEQALWAAKAEQVAAGDKWNALQERERGVQQCAREAQRSEVDAVERAARAFAHLEPEHRPCLCPGAGVAETFAPEMLNGEHPTQAQVLAWRGEVACEASARRQAKMLAAQMTAREQERVRREPVANRVAVLEAVYPPESEQSLRTQEARATHERQDAERERIGLSEPLAQSETAWRNAHSARQQAVDALSQAEARAVSKAVQRAEAERVLERLRADLPSPWREAAVPSTGALSSSELQHRLDAWRAEARLLQELPRRLEEVKEALQQDSHRRQRLTEVERDIDGVPHAARRDLADIEAESAGVECQRGSFARERDEAGALKRRLQDRRDEKDQLEQQERNALRQSKLSRHLFDLLGRDGLQRYLLQEAEAGIVDNANHVLDRLSGGSLRLELRAPAGEADAKVGTVGASGETPSASSSAKTLPKAPVKALDLVARNAEVAGESESVAPLPVAFLSGSQRFRVSVALALGIGQYASVGAGRIESVIVDEGFGSLDKAGTREMIEELHLLGGTLARVIVVSHQDDFAQAFANRYSIELHGGTSCVALQGRE